MFPVNLFLIPRCVKRFGLHRLIGSGSLVNILVHACLAAWAGTLDVEVDGSVVPLLLGISISLVALLFTQNPNLARCKLIADTYAKDARGAITGVSRNFFALGQAVSPMLSGVLFNLNPLAPYAAACAFLLANISIFVALGVPLTRDPAVRSIVISPPLEDPVASTRTPEAAACTTSRAQVAPA
jgi:hypothetical protein